jgi:hypothetical protein
MAKRLHNKNYTKTNRTIQKSKIYFIKFNDKKMLTLHFLQGNNNKN